VQTTTPSFETLNAYVDGELDTGHAAEVSRAIASNSELARQVAVLSQLRLSIAESIDTPLLKLPVQSSSGGRNVKHFLVAACVAGLLAVGAFLLEKASVGDTVAEWIPSAWEIHQAWDIAATDVPYPNNLGDLVKVSLIGGLVESYVPDLTSAKLTVAYVSKDVLYRGQQSLLVGYTGTRGCKVSLLVTGESAPLSDELTFFQRDQVSLYGWHVGHLDYMLMAEGMASERFRSIANAVYESTKIRLPMNPSTQTLLAESRAKSAPCVT
jgi:hypothetical protein